MSDSTTNLPKIALTEKANKEKTLQELYDILKVQQKAYQKAADDVQHMYKLMHALDYIARPRFYATPIGQQIKHLNLDTCHMMSAILNDYIKEIAVFEWQQSVTKLKIQNKQLTKDDIDDFFVQVAIINEKDKKGLLTKPESKKFHALVTSVEKTEVDKNTVIQHYSDLHSLKNEIQERKLKTKAKNLIQANITAPRKESILAIKHQSSFQKTYADIKWSQTKRQLVNTGIVMFSAAIFAMSLTTLNPITVGLGVAASTLLLAAMVIGNSILAKPPYNKNRNCFGLFNGNNGCSQGNTSAHDKLQIPKSLGIN